jgi:methylmalonyl-CoA/ethylmalonyl-CoA epimerase
MSTPFQQLHHICLVVQDIDRTQAYYESIGIGPWREYPPLTDYVDLDVPNPEAFNQLKYRVVDLANVQIQLCEPPHADCPQRRFLDEHGEGVFQLGFEHDVATAVVEGKALGLEVLMRGQRSNRTGFVYFDTLDQAGVTLIARATPPPAS